MRLLAVELVDLRNLRRVVVEPHPRLNVLAGPNGQGKTNFLEGIFLLGTLRGLRASRLDELVRWGEARATARARVERGELTRLYEVEITASPALKRARVDGKGVRTADYFGGFNVVLFAPEDLKLVRGSPSERRRFLDRAVWNADPLFLGAAQIYERVLRSRNALLRAPDAARRTDELEVYDGQLARAGVEVAARRRRFCDALAPRVTAAYEQITRSGLPLTARYVSSVTDESALLAALGESRRKDLARGFTGPGPHGDDLELDLDGRPARIHASQGQVRATVLSLKVAEIEQLTEVLGQPPILLLDDVSSELDAARQAYLFEFVASLSCQAYLTTTTPERLALPEERETFQVLNGTITG